jgi:cation diffusion facilitator CzcD-associated flavoprotein CzcO
MTGSTSSRDFDAIVVGAGIGGLYGVHRLRQQNLTVLGIESAADVGGVWYHNRYPGARVDVESYDYCYYFSQELYREWRWSEKYATQPELLRYLNHVADRFDIRRHFVFDTWMTSARWHPDEARYHVMTSTGRKYTCRFLIMATGQLSAARKPEFAGLDRFRGEWVQTAHWPQREVKLEGRSIGVIGTGSSGVQVIPVAAEVAQHVYVFQRTAKYSIPARNGPMDESLWQTIQQDVTGERQKLFEAPGAAHMAVPKAPAASFAEAEQHAILEEYWARGGQHMQAVFTDQSTNIASNEVIANFVREKIRSIVRDPVLAEKLCPNDHPDNVTLVDVRSQPIARVTETGIQTADGSHYALDLIILALGFDAFTGSLYRANICNEHGFTPADRWRHGPRTLLGLMTKGFPNLFLPTGPGSPSLIANLTVQNEFHMDWIAECIDYLAKHGFATIEPTAEAEDRWTEHVADVAKHLLRRQTNNYMVHVNEDGSRIYMPYAGGMDRFVKRAREIAANGYAGFHFTAARS